MPDIELGSNYTFEENSNGDLVITDGDGSPILSHDDSADTWTIVDPASVGDLTDESTGNTVYDSSAEEVTANVNNELVNTEGLDLGRYEIDETPSGNLIVKDPNDNTLFEWDEAAGEWDFAQQSISNLASLSTDEQFITGNQLYLQATEPTDLTDAAWINTNPLPASNVLATVTADQNIPSSATPTTVDFGNAVRDVNNEFDLGNNGFTPIEDGQYQISGQVKYDGGGTDDNIGSFIYIDGNLDRRRETFRPEIGENIARAGTLSFPPITVELDAGQTLSARFRNETNSCTLLGLPEFSYLSISRVA